MIYYLDHAGDEIYECFFQRVTHPCSRDYLAFLCEPLPRISANPGVGELLLEINDDVRQGAFGFAQILQSLHEHALLRLDHGLALLQARQPHHFSLELFLIHDGPDLLKEQSSFVLSLSH